MLRPVAVLTLAIMATGSAALLPAHAADAPGRYTLTPNGAGFVRLDTQTGQVSDCSGTPSNLVCKSAPDERTALQAEIDRLATENAKLKALGSGTTADAQPQFTIPSDQEVDKAFSFLERVMKRFKGLIEDIRKQPADSIPL